MTIISIDPGPRDSAYVIWNGAQVLESDNVENEHIICLCQAIWSPKLPKPDVLVIEQIRGFGIPAGNDLLDTCWWSGRFYQAWGFGAHMLPRKDVLSHLGYGGSGNKDKAVREALIARFGPPGTKKAPNILYGISSHLWAALAVAVTWFDLHAEG